MSEMSGTEVLTSGCGEPGILSMGVWGSGDPEIAFEVSCLGEKVRIPKAGDVAGPGGFKA